MRGAGRGRNALDCLGASLFIVPRVIPECGLCTIIDIDYVHHCCVSVPSGGFTNIERFHTKSASVLLVRTVDVLS